MVAYLDSHGCCGVERLCFGVPVFEGGRGDEGEVLGPKTDEAVDTCCCRGLAPLYACINMCMCCCLIKY